MAPAAALPRDPFAGTILADEIPDRRGARLLAHLGPGPYCNGRWQRSLPQAAAVGDQAPSKAAG